MRKLHGICGYIYGHLICHFKSLLHLLMSARSTCAFGEVSNR